MTGAISARCAVSQAAIAGDASHGSRPQAWRNAATRPRRRDGVEALEQLPRLRLADPQVVVVRRRRGLARGHRDADGQPRPNQVEQNLALSVLERQRAVEAPDDGGRGPDRVGLAEHRVGARDGEVGNDRRPDHVAEIDDADDLAGVGLRRRRPPRCSRSSRCGSPAVAGVPRRGATWSSNRASTRSIRRRRARVSRTARARRQSRASPSGPTGTGRRIAPCENPSNARLVSPTRRPRLSSSASVCGFTSARTSPGTQVSILTRCCRPPPPVAWTIVSPDTDRQTLGTASEGCLPARCSSAAFWNSRMSRGSVALAILRTNASPPAVAMRKFWSRSLGSASARPTMRNSRAAQASAEAASNCGACCTTTSMVGQPCYHRVSDRCRQREHERADADTPDGRRDGRAREPGAGHRQGPGGRRRPTAVRRRARPSRGRDRAARRDPDPVRARLGLPGHAPVARSAPLSREPVDGRPAGGRDPSDVPPRRHRRAPEDSRRRRCCWRPPSSAACASRAPGSSSTSRTPRRES